MRDGLRNLHYDLDKRVWTNIAHGRAGSAGTNTNPNTFAREEVPPQHSSRSTSDLDVSF